MHPIIPKSPEVPDLTEAEIDFLTNVVFGPKKEIKKCDALFVFSGTHPGHWEKALEAYKQTGVKKIIVTGGNSLTGVKHPEWQFGNKTEADVIIDYLLAHGVPSGQIFAEKLSTNSLENVKFALNVFDFSQINSLMFVCKSHAAGRQLRTLTKYLPSTIKYVPYTFDAEYSGQPVSREQWMASSVGRSRVWGEYLRILYYGQRGDISPLEIAP
ncbi:YdcF family protein [Oenococcus kitaharae]|uniref:Group-specific protein n=1 Tax=Oenococcus kitaharae DSM 17330 TaxID=1045004 RepID=G9WFW4_9LACO|nr:YdcF family protein [Oenococcus kitaharae]EHN59487.1 group-specific protein [Oenococcus kitaharae DSM 17330]OEY83348.1 hypothetical protein NT95_04225 [Oenococcus kitaharae]OEY85147.1 hypothetical protein NT96_00670 [Oenococcus kitaharae]OEY86002.1 hypothetical protein NV75_00620 [Oenococcus kitaharae]